MCGNSGSGGTRRPELNGMHIHWSQNRHRVRARVHLEKKQAPKDLLLCASEEYKLLA